LVGAFDHGSHNWRRHSGGATPFQRERRRFRLIFALSTIPVENSVEKHICTVGLAQCYAKLPQLLKKKAILQAFETTQFLYDNASRH
jgi:hypothetical protein